MISYSKCHQWGSFNGDHLDYYKSHFFEYSEYRYGVTFLI